MGIDRGSQGAGHATGVHINPWTLVFSGTGATALEQGFRQQQKKMWAACELRNLYLNLAAAVVNFTITACQLQLFQVRLARHVSISCRCFSTTANAAKRIKAADVRHLLPSQGCLFTVRSAQVVLPYMVVAIVHWLMAARWQQWPRHRAVCNLLFEVSGMLQ